MLITADDLLRIQAGLKHYVQAWSGHPDGAERAAAYADTLAKIDKLIEGEPEE